MLMPFREMQRRVQRRVSNVDTGITLGNAVLPKIKDWLNERYERILRSFPWEETLDSTTLSIVASQRAYALGEDTDKVWVIFDQTNGRIIKFNDVQTQNRFYSTDLDQTGNVQVGDPVRCYSIGRYTVKAVTPTAAVITVESSSTADVSPNVIRVRGLVGSVPMSETITLTGTTPVSSSNTYAISQKLQVAVGTSDKTDKSVVGYITIKSGSTTLAVIAPQDWATPYQWIEVSPLPKATGTQPTWKIWYGRRMNRLTDDNDIPIVDCCLEMIQGAYSDALKEDGQPWQEEEANWVAQVQELLNNQRTPAMIEQFVPESMDLIQTLDYGRIIGTE